MAGWAGGIGIASLLKGVFDGYFPLGLPAGGLVIKASSAIVAVTAGVAATVLAGPGARAAGVPPAGPGGAARARGRTGAGIPYLFGTRVGGDGGRGGAVIAGGGEGATVAGVAVAAMFTVLGASLKASAAQGWTAR